MTSEQRKQQLANLFGVYDKRLEKLYDNYIRKMTQLAKQAGVDTEDYISKEGLFRFEKYPELNAEFKSIFDDYVRDNLLNYKSAITSGVTLAFSHQASALSGFSILSDKAISLVRDNAAQTFLRSRLNTKQGLNLSQLVWNYAQQSKSEFEVSVSNVISDGLKKGTSAEELGRKIREYLNNPDMMYRRYHRTVVDAGGNKKDEVTWRRKAKDEEGKTRFVEEPLENVGSGHYRSSRKNATRLMRTEINMAYLRANWERWQKEPFVTGIHIHLSPQHPDHDECDELEGYYPKDFLFIGWHPQCYSDDTKVLTDSGWKLFKDVEIADKILSLNPETRNVEYVGIKERQKWEKNGDMIHFFNRNTDCLVTPEHRMVYLNKSDGRIKYCSAKEYRKGLGGFYRGCIYEGERRDSITIGNTVINFDLFCEFMGYYLSDGSLVRTHQIIISQQEGQPYKQDMITCINRMGFRTKVDNTFISFYSGDLCKYLRRFGRCNQKYIPEEIKNSSKEQIEIFLSAFAKCDGTIKKVHPFIGSHGNICLPNSGERMFFTTSQRMAGDISELLLKIGHRPSIREVQPRDSVKKDGTIIHSNYICYKISDCKSQTATVFDKEIIKYKGYVYDLTLERNHIMYVQRNGRCYWGSNCMCTSDPITIYGDEKKAFYRRMAQGEDMSNYVSPNAIKDVPDNFKKFIQDNKSKFISAGEREKLGYVWKENLKYVRPQLSAEEQARMGILNTTTTSQPTSAFVNSLIRLKNLLPRDIQNAINNGIDKNQLPIIGKRVSAEIKEKEVRILNYAREFTGRSKVIDNLVNDYKYIKGIDRLEALDKIREKCAIATRYDLRKALNIDSKSGLVYDSINKDFVLQKAETKVVNGKTIKIPEKICDMIIYRDSFGKKYGFELAYNKLQPDAKEITDMIKLAPSWARKYFNSLYFINDSHPMDLFYREAYKGFTKGAMYSGEPITVHWSYKGNTNQFKFDIFHEIGHHIDNTNFVSKSKDWLDAIRRDGYIFRNYSKNRPNEDFADAISSYLLYSFTYMNTYFPNRLAILQSLISSL